MSRWNRTYRPPNGCHMCGHTWHPRGSWLSSRCPSCRSTSVYDATPIPRDRSPASLESEDAARRLSGLILGAVVGLIGCSCLLVLLVVMLVAPDVDRGQPPAFSKPVKQPTRAEPLVIPPPEPDRRPRK